MKIAVEFEIRKTGNGFEVVGAGLQQVRGQAAAARGELSGVDEALNSIGSRLGAAAVVAGVGAAMGAALTTGVRFNALLESSQIGLASIIAQTSELTDAEGRRLTGIEEFNEGQRISIGLQRELKIAAIETSAGYDELLSGLQAVLVTHRGAFDSKQVVEFTKNLSQAAAAIDPMLLKEGQFAQEIRGLLEGDLSRSSRLARIIFSDFTGGADELKAKLEELRKEGKLFDFLQERLNAFAIGGQASLNTLNTAASNFRDVIMQLTGEATQGLTTDLTAALNRVAEGFTYVDEEGKRAFRPELVQSIEEIADAVGWVATNLSTLIALFPEWQSEIERTSDRLHERLVTGLRNLFEEYERIAQNPVVRQILKLTPGGSVIDWYAMGPASGAGGLRDWATRRSQEIEAERLRAEQEQLRNRQVGEQLLAGASTDVGGGPAAIGARFQDWAERNTEAAKAFYAEIKKGAKDAAVSSIDFARANQAAAKTLSELDRKKLGRDGGGGDDDAAKELQKQEDALAKINQENARAIELTNIRRNSGAALTAEQERLVELQVSLTELTNRHADAAEKINKLTRVPAAEREVALSRLNLRMEGERGALMEKYFAATLRSMDEYEAKQRALIEEGRNLTQSVNQATVQAFRDALETQREEWQEFFDQIGQGISGAFRSVARGGDAQSALESIFDGALNALESQVDKAIAGMMERLALAAAGQQRVQTGTDAAGNPIYGFAPRAGGQSQAALYGMGALQGAAALYGLYQQGQAGATPGQNALSGAAQGAALGAQLGGVYGAVIGAFVGGLAGVFTGKNKPAFTVRVSGGRLTIEGGGEATEADIQKALDLINDTILDYSRSVLEIFEAFPAAMMESLFTVLKPEDIFPDMAIGERNRDEGRNFLGKLFYGDFGGGGSPVFRAVYNRIHETKGQLSGEELEDFIRNGIPELIFDAYAPIFREGLIELEVTEDRLRELLDKVPGFDPKEALERVRKFVEVLVGFMDSEEFNQLTGEGLMARAAEELGETPIDAIRRMGDEIVTLTRGFADLPLDLQIERGERILELETERQEAVLAYLHEIGEVQRTIFESVEAQLREIDLYGKGPFATREALQARQADLLTAIGSAQTPGEIQALASEYQQLVGRVFELTVRLPEEIRGLIDGFEGLDEILAPERSPIQRLADLQDKMNDANRRMLEATNPDDQISAARELLALTQERYELERQMLNELNAAIEAINESITAQIADIGLQGRLTEAEARGASPQELANIEIDFLQRQQRDLRDRLSVATDANEIQQIVAEMQRNAGRLFSLMGETPEAAAQITRMLEDIRNLANTRLREAINAITAQDEANRNMITGAIATLNTALGSVGTAAEEAKDALDALKETIGARFEELTNDVIEANRDLLETIGDILEILRGGLREMFPENPTPPGGGPDPSVPPGPDVQVPIGANSYSGPQAAQEEMATYVDVTVPQPVVYVTLAGSAEKLIDSVIAEAELAGARLAIQSVANRARRRSGF